MNTPGNQVDRNKLNDTSAVKREISRFGFSKPYWEATREKKLVIQRCRVTGKYQHYPRPVSIYTGRRRDIEWHEVSGKGEIFSDRKSTRLNSSHSQQSRMPSSA